MVMRLAILVMLAANCTTVTNSYGIAPADMSAGAGYDLAETDRDSPANDLISIAADLLSDMTRPLDSAVCQAADRCIKDYCLCGASHAWNASTLACESADGGSVAFYQCRTDQSGNFTEVDGSVLKAGMNSPCLVCLNDAAAALHGQSCWHPSSADCNPSQCAATVNTCLGS